MSHIVFICTIILANVLPLHHTTSLCVCVCVCYGTCYGVDKSGLDNGSKVQNLVFF